MSRHPFFVRVHMFQKLVIELIDAVVAIIIIGVILAKLFFPWNIIAISLMVAPFGIGVIRMLYAKKNEAWL